MECWIWTVLVVSHRPYCHCVVHSWYREVFDYLSIQSTVHYLLILHIQWYIEILTLITDNKPIRLVKCICIWPNDECAISEGCKNSWCIQGPYNQCDTIEILLLNHPPYKYSTFHLSTFVPVNPDIPFYLAVVK